MYSYVKHIAIDTKTVFHIDIDVPIYDDVFDTIAVLAPYFKSTTKSYGKHILITSETFTPVSKRMQFKNEGVDLLCGQWSYAPLDGEMLNADCAVNQILNLEEMLKISNKADEKVIGPVLTDDQIKNNTSNELEKFKIMSQCYTKKRISDYDTYFKLTMAVKNSFGDTGKSIWEDICSRGDNYDMYKNNEQWFKYTPKNKDDKLLKFGSLVKRAKDDNPEKYKELFGEKLIGI